MTRPENCGSGYCSCVECPFTRKTQRQQVMRNLRDGFFLTQDEQAEAADFLEGLLAAIDASVALLQNGKKKDVDEAARVLSEFSREKV